MLALAQHTSGFQRLSPPVRFELADRPIGEAGEVSIRGGSFAGIAGGLQGFDTLTLGSLAPMRLYLP
jgi:hypothetical protein